MLCQEYLSLLLSADAVSTLVRKEELFFIDLSCPVLQTQYDMFATRITEVWQTFDASFSADVTVVAIDRYLTESSTFVYALFYKASVNGAMIASTQVAAPAFSDFASPIGQIMCPRGGAVGVIDSMTTTVRRYRSAFYSFTVMPVRRADIDGVLTSLTTAWENIIGAGAHDVISEVYIVA